MQDIKFTGMALKNRLYFLWIPVLLLFLASCSDKDDPAPKPQNGNLVEATPLGTWRATNLKLLAQLAGMDVDVSLIAHDVKVFRVTYQTTYRDEDVNASGLVLIPQSSGAVPMISFHRGTTVEQTEVPSAQELESEDVLSYSALASMGFITAAPDMIGFGTSKDIFHPYYVEQPTADAVRDILTAARELAEKENTGFDGRVFLAGYSQGGYITMAAHKSLEAEPIEGFEVVASFPGAGGYDIRAMLDLLRPSATYPDPYYIAYLGMSYQTYYDEPNLLTSFFREPYASKIPGLFDGVNSGSYINSQLTEDLPALIREEVLNGDEGYPANDFLEDRFTENSPLDWTPSAPVFLYHGDEDDVVPLINSQVAYEQLLANGADHVELTIFPGYNHGSAVVPYIEAVVGKLDELK